MKGFAKRVITACVAVPVLIILVVSLPQADYLAFCVVIMALTALGSVEMHQLLSKDRERLLFTYYSGVLLPLAQYAQFRYVPDV